MRKPNWKKKKNGYKVEAMQHSVGNPWSSAIIPYLI